jgi:alanyl-tRNA synthetase
LAILTDQGEKIARASQGQRLILVCPQTSFYAESGGQTGDFGEIVGEKGSAVVMGTTKTAEGVFLHHCEVMEGALCQGESVELRVAEGRRQRIAANHTATHLLQAALQEALGDHVKQSGSLVEEERLRFDFTHFSPMTEQEIETVEQLVNQEIRANVVNCVDHMDKEEAKKSGATALFGEKYDDVVRVVSFGQKSRELCGGTHVGATGEIGLFKIVGETGIAAGIRRIVAVTGEKALERVQGYEKTIAALARELKTTPDEVVKKVKSNLLRQKELEKEIGQLTAQLSISGLDSIVDGAREIGGVKVVTAKIQLDSAKTLREIGDKVRDKIGSGVVVLGGELDGKAALLAVVTKDVCGKCHAGKIIKEVAGIVGGSGGGRPDMAQAGGSMPDKLAEALQAVYEIIEQQMA